MGGGAQDLAWVCHRSLIVYICAKGGAGLHYSSLVLSVLTVGAALPL